MSEMNKALRIAVILAGAVVLSYFVLGVFRLGGHEVANVAGSVQNKID